MMGRPKKIHTEQDKVERQVPLDVIDAPEVPARNTIIEAKVHELAASMKATGQLQAIALRPHGKRFEVIFGHRRVLAAHALSWATIRARIEHVNEEVMWSMRIVENDDRLDTTPLEQAHSYAQLAKHGKLTQKQLAARIGRSEAFVSQRLAILNYPPMLQAALGVGDINFSVARHLCKITDSAALKMYLSYCIENGATPALAERWVADLKTETNPTGEDVQRLPDNYNPEHLAPPSAKCHYCDTDHPYNMMSNVWMCFPCGKNAIEALLQMAEGSE